MVRFLSVAVALVCATNTINAHLIRASEWRGINEEAEEDFMLGPMYEDNYFEATPNEESNNDDGRGHSPDDETDDTVDESDEGTDDDTDTDTDGRGHSSDDETDDTVDDSDEGTDADTGADGANDDANDDAEEDTDNMEAQTEDFWYQPKSKPPHPPKKACFSVEKGMKCGGMGAKNKMGGKCEAGMTKEFHAEMSGSNMDDILLTDITPDLREQLIQMIPSVEEMMPYDTVDEDGASVMEQLRALDDTGKMKKLLGGEGKKSMTVNFGGAAMMHWGCKATVSFDEGKLSKKVECGAKGGGGAGMTPGNMGEQKNAMITTAPQPYHHHMTIEL
eukprot:CAMPEP_0202456662 /NCGR_PEP_ID=MMETSP1360-20130828/13865_1 /ASSEMBLY_ACC=CAM_ASM_000848 /TAXON_ID=515479 /ORGANISM="Licmophora paradoxa, Strain CCMP2313" /LENGTH=332 /DNA_ID=CAMNT_0049076535 /DNA_START=37 /DNA_END=1035 /DNA_ORIENTATION=-